jgi:hypothetical protein
MECAGRREYNSSMLQKQEICDVTCGEREIECKKNILSLKINWERMEGEIDRPLEKNRAGRLQVKSQKRHGTS